MKKLALLLAVVFCLGSVSIAMAADKAATTTAPVKVAVKKVVKVKKGHKKLAKGPVAPVAPTTK